MIKTEIVVIGSGPGGYSAAFRLADLGKKVILVEQYANLGGVCLNVGCIPSKTLLHTAKVISEAKTAQKLGIEFSPPKIDLAAIRQNKNNIVSKLTAGISALAKARKVKVLSGYARFISPHQIEVAGEVITFESCIIATGSRVRTIENFPTDKRIIDSTDALDLKDIPKKLLIVGGGIIGLEMASVYHALGSEITIVELSDSLIPSADKDIIAPLYKYIKKQYQQILLATKILEITAKDDGIYVHFKNKTTQSKACFDKVLVAIGRIPNGYLIDADKAGINVDDNGFIASDNQMRTHVEHIFAIGDIKSEPMLAHKAVHEAKIAAEVICGKKATFDALSIPSVAYVDPEVAWVGKTENELKEENIAYEKGVFPWAASGRNLSIGRKEGITKALFDKKTKRLIGMGICGTNAGELIAEATLAIEMGSDMTDIALTIHPHPTLSETLAFSAEVAEGTITDLLLAKK